MIPPGALFGAFRDRSVTFFTGVPDSLLKDFCAYVTDHADKDRHVIAANEGNAVALATGWYLGTSEPALVYMQNSGLGNAINPLTSLTDPEVYGIPMLIMVGWRGESGTEDQPQHTKQGRITPRLLEAMELPRYVLDAASQYEAVINEACQVTRENGTPVILLIKKNTFEPYELRTKECDRLQMTREEAIRTIIELLGPDDMVISSTGKISRELYECREARNEDHGNDFLTVGSMGHASSIAMGLATARPKRKVICLDGDGSSIMHMGAMAVIGQKGPGNLFHIVLNNGVHDSVGGQPTVGLGIDMPTMAKACGYRHPLRVERADETREAFNRLQDMEGPVFLEVRVKRGSRKDLGRPKTTPKENRDALMRKLDIHRRK